MSKYFKKYPKAYYSFDPAGGNTRVATDITFPVSLLEKFASDSQYYYTIIVKDGLKPEDVAYLVYGDVELHWVILKFNQIVDPRFDWPLSSNNLSAYIIKKYGSIQAANQTIINYFKIIKRTSSLTPTVQASEYIEIGASEYANVPLNLGGTSYQLSDGSSVNEIIDRSTINAYDYELSLNESRREIRLIQKQYIDSIRASFNNLVK